MPNDSDDLKFTLLLIGFLLLGALLGGVATDDAIHERLSDDSILINCIQIGEETLNGETSTFYTCEGIR